jgi:hypothetical protein
MPSTCISKSHHHPNQFHQRAASRTSRLRRGGTATLVREDAPRDPQDRRRREQANSTWEQEELISLPSDLPLLRTLQKELPTASKGTRLRMVIDKQPEGTRPPNLADAVVMAYWPVDAHAYDSTMS